VLGEEHTFKVFENSVLRGDGPERDEITNQLIEGNNFVLS
jgi:hypothetical protein